MRQVRIYVDTINDGEISFLATTMIGAQTVTARGANEALAVAALRSELRRRADVEKAREGYPKTIEVDW